MEQTMNENYKLLIETEWKDVHHSRIQEWSALGVIAAAHIGLIQLLNFIHSLIKTGNLYPYLVFVCCLIALLFCVIGILMTCRHRRLMWIKLNWIFEAEEKLRLIKTQDNPNGIIPEDYKMLKSNHYKEVLEELKKNIESDLDPNQITKSTKSVWNKLMWPRFLSTSWLLVALYFLLGVIDLGFLIFSLTIKL
jgi:hypothetical protein